MGSNRIIRISFIPSVTIFIYLFIIIIIIIIIIIVLLTCIRNCSNCVHNLIAYLILYPQLNIWHISFITSHYYYYLFIAFDEGERFLISWVSCER